MAEDWSKTCGEGKEGLRIDTDAPVYVEEEHDSIPHLFRQLDEDVACVRPGLPAARRRSLVQEMHDLVVREAELIRSAQLTSVGGYATPPSQASGFGSLAAVAEVIAGRAVSDTHSVRFLVPTLVGILSAHTHTSPPQPKASSPPCRAEQHDK